MAWDDELIPAVRGMVGDDGVTPKYTDAQLKTLAVVSAGQLQLEVPAWGAQYETAVATPAISPDPSDNAAFMTLLALKTACAVSRGEVVKAAGQAIRLKDGRSEIDLRDAFRARLAAADGSWCKAYATALSDYRKGALSTAEFVWLVTTPGRDAQLPPPLGTYWGTL